MGLWWKSRNFAIVIELHRHIEILLLDNDCVIIPEFGGFMAHHVEARYDDGDHTFLPPSRTLGFNRQLRLNDSLLAQSYVEAYDLSYPEALTRIGDEVEEMRQHLHNEGFYELNDLGVLYYADNGTYTFEPCEAGILTPSLYGLNSIDILRLSTLETLSVERNAELVVKEQEKDVAKSTQRETKPLLLEMDETVKSLSNGVEEDSEEAETNNDNLIIPVTWLRNAVAVCVAVVAFLLFPSTVTEGEVNTVSHSMVDTGLLTTVMPKEMIKGHENIAEIKAPIPAVAKSATKSREQIKPTNDVKANEPFYCLVLASKITKRNANRYVQILKDKGYNEAETLIDDKDAKVIYGRYETMNEAYLAFNKLHKKADFKDCWVMRNKAR